jgi:N-formylglutamate deformylase
MKLPLLISVPHAGLTIPEEVKELCALNREQIIADSDEDATEIYALESAVTSCIKTDIARVVADVNRSEEDRGPDGVVKVNTCYGIEVYREPLSEDLIENLLDRYVRPYHRQLTELAKNVEFGLDCHTMAAYGPPIAQDAGLKRPEICLSNADRTCPRSLLEGMAACFENVFNLSPALNSPFKGGHIVRSHAAELPWIQVELSRASFMPTFEKHDKVLKAIELFCKTVL